MFKFSKMEKKAIDNIILYNKIIFFFRHFDLHCWTNSLRGITY